MVRHRRVAPVALPRKVMPVVPAVLLQQVVVVELAQQVRQQVPEPLVPVVPVTFCHREHLCGYRVVELALALHQHRMQTRPMVPLRQPQMRHRQQVLVVEALVLPTQAVALFVEASEQPASCYSSISPHNRW